MICVSSNDLPCRVETLSLDKQGLCEVSWKIATCNAVRRSTVALFEVVSVPRGSCFVLAHRWKGKLYVCSLFLSGFDTDDLCSLASVRHV